MNNEIYFVQSIDSDTAILVRSDDLATIIINFDNIAAWRYLEVNQAAMDRFAAMFGQTLDIVFLEHLATRADRGTASQVELRLSTTS